MCVCWYVVNHPGDLSSPTNIPNIPKLARGAWQEYDESKERQEHEAPVFLPGGGISCAIGYGPWTWGTNTPTQLVISSTELSYVINFPILVIIIMFVPSLYVTCCYLFALAAPPQPTFNWGQQLVSVDLGVAKHLDATSTITELTFCLKAIQSLGKRCNLCPTVQLIQ